jgi:hypothetical protein
MTLRYREIRTMWGDSIFAGEYAGNRATLCLSAEKYTGSLIPKAIVSMSWVTLCVWVPYLPSRYSLERLAWTLTVVR